MVAGSSKLCNKLEDIFKAMHNLLIRPPPGVWHTCASVGPCLHEKWHQEYAIKIGKLIRYVSSCDIATAIRKWLNRTADF
jgi:hypothetical protein